MNKVQAFRIIFILFVILFVVVKLLSPFYTATLQVMALTTIRDHTEKYHSTEQIYDSIHKGEVEPFYRIDMLPNSGMLAFSPSVAPQYKQYRVMIVCGQHGRELVSSELCYTMISLLQNKIKEIKYVVELQALKLEEVGFYIVPVVNAHSRHLAYALGSCARTNFNGVDPNRNFPSEFPKPPAHLYPPGSEEYAGAYPLSEPESIDLDKYMSYVKPHILLNIHSGGNAVLIPYDADVIDQPPHYKHIVRILNHIKSSSLESPHFQFDFKMGPSSILYYPAHGTLMDYSINTKGVDVALTLEIFANESQKGNCLNFYNPRPGIELSDTIEKWIHFILLFTKRIVKQTVIDEQQ